LIQLFINVGYQKNSLAAIQVLNPALRFICQRRKHGKYSDRADCKFDGDNAMLIQKSDKCDIDLFNSGTSVICAASSHSEILCLGIAE